MKKFVAGWVFAFGVGGALAQAPKAPAAQVDAAPAMWQVKGVHGSVYLFGTVHVMRKDVPWETAKVKDALKASDVLYLEIADIDPDSVQKMAPMMMELGMDLEHPLSTKISKEDVALLDAAATKLGLPGESALEPLKPWLVYAMLSVVPISQSGYDPASGIDQILLGEAKAQGKPVKGFETAEKQMHYLSDFPEAQQVALLHQELIDLPKTTSGMDDMVADWTSGKVEKIAAMENDEMKAKTPELYDKLLVKRNEQFADAIAGLLNDPQTSTVFVAVGAAHLAGPDSVVKMLTTKGFTVTRVE
jgi:uncharacterized protein